MAGLQRSSVSFRRQGSSGLIWNDKFFSGELKPTNRRYEEQHQPQSDAVSLSPELRPSRSVGSSGSYERSRSSAAHRMEIISPSPPPPSTANPSSSTKFAGCGFCGVFGRPIGSPRHQKSNKRSSD